MTTAYTWCGVCQKPYERAGKLPLRPGVRRLVKEALDNGAKVAVCSTSNERAVKAGAAHVVSS